MGLEDQIATGDISKLANLIETGTGTVDLQGNLYNQLRSFYGSLGREIRTKFPKDVKAVGFSRVSESLGSREDYIEVKITATSKEAAARVKSGLSEVEPFAKDSKGKFLRVGITYPVT